VLDALIDKTDRYEQIRDIIAAILKAESLSQQALAVTASKDPDLWKLRVFVERSNPWEQWVNNADDKSPIISVWFDNDNVDLGASNLIQRQKYEGVFNIDCYGYGESAYDGASGHTPGDLTAALESQRAARLVRNILMSQPYYKLAAPSLVIDRYVQSRTTFQPPIGADAAFKVIASRLDFRVTYNEFSPQNTPETLEYLAIDIKQIETGELLAEVDIDYTT
jgi:hypothetical protein